LTKRILYLVHALPPEEQTGTTLLAAGYADEMARRGWEVFVLHASRHVSDWDTVATVLRPGEAYTRIAVPLSPPGVSYWPLYGASESGGPSAPSSGPFERLLTEVAPDLIHVVDNVDLPLDWPERAQRRGIPVIRTVSCAEDLCGLIPPVSPMSDRAGYCLAPLTPERCARCLLSTGSFPQFEADTAEDSVALRDELVGYLQRKRARAVAQFDATFDRIIFSSPGFRSYFEGTVPLDPAKVSIVPLGINPRPEQRRHSRSRAEGSPLVFGLAGVLAAAKGFDALADACADPALVSRDDYRVLIIGSGDESLIADLLAANRQVTAMGPYRPDELPELFRGIDVGLSISRFETFHRVTREYLLSGVPVVGSLAFGIPDVIHHGDNGLLFDHGQPGSLRDAMLSLLDEPELLSRITKGAQGTEIRTVSDEIDDLESLYRRYI
jgi:glycosyltransferase involved in cell wall biosynthesis